VYDGFVVGGSLPQQYIDYGRQIAEKQIVLAGHRLANLLVSLDLDDYAEPIIDEAES